MLPGIFKIAFNLRDRHAFMWQSFEILNVLKNENPFQKTGFESTKNENAIFPFKTSLSEANVKKNRIESAKWTYHKERSFASN